ncbi:FAD/NAD(P)-binding domain-containing protein [Aspergillus floccosus]
MAPGSHQWRQLNVAIIGGGIGLSNAPGGLAAAVSLRRAGHRVTIYERGDYSGSLGASISCGEIQDIYDLSAYTSEWGYEYYNFFRADMHAMLMASATGPGVGDPALLKPHHVCDSVDHATGTVSFQNNVTARHDLVIGADGVGSSVRRALEIYPQRMRATSTCYHCVIRTADVRKLGLADMSRNDALEYWGGQGLEKIVFAPCREGEIHSFYIFFPTPTSEKKAQMEEGWNFAGNRRQLLAPFPTLDPVLRALFNHADPIDIAPWRLFIHEPYPYWSRGHTCILGDAAHPMLPDQSQGACQAIEDAAALGIIFGPLYRYTNDVHSGLQLYEKVRKPRASKVQAASARARENISERVGFSSQKGSKWYGVAREDQKLTIEEINEFVPCLD